jgi:hypothetical protein
MTTCTGELTFATSQTLSGLPFTLSLARIVWIFQYRSKADHLGGRKATEIAVSENGHPLTNALQFG